MSVYNYTALLPQCNFNLELIIVFSFNSYSSLVFPTDFSHFNFIIIFVNQFLNTFYAYLPMHELFY